MAEVKTEVKCDACGSTEVELKAGKYHCKRCGNEQNPKRKQYTFPLSEPMGKYAKKGREVF